MSRLKLYPANGWPSIAGWLDDANSTALERALVYRALADVGVLEVPYASNRGTRIDAINARFGSPLGSWWCGNWAGGVLADCGCFIPNDPGSTQNWVEHLEPLGTLPRPGWPVLYGVDGKAHHVGICVRIEIGYPTITIEGNRSFAGTASNNGVAVDLGPMSRRDILGYFRPRTSLVSA